jgi:hypothetical protein
MDLIGYGSPWVRFKSRDLEGDLWANLNCGEDEGRDNRFWMLKQKKDLFDSHINERKLCLGNSLESWFRAARELINTANIEPVFHQPL